MSVRVEHIGAATLYLGNAFDVLAMVDRVDHVFTDPPYSENTHKQAKTNKGRGTGTKLVEFAHFTDDDFDAAVERALSRAAAWGVLTCDYRHAARAFDHPRFLRLGAWVKPNPMPQISADRPGQGFETVLILHAGGRPKAWNRGGGAATWTVPPVSGAEVSTQKPLPLLKAWVSDFTLPGEIILDPFMGSGTTGVAALLMGRKFVGIEADPHRFAIACRRLADAQAIAVARGEDKHGQTDLFGEAA
jgi:site-specific DNA-methyltransferase (adenine-specific)